MNILITGMTQSGSTLFFNIVISVYKTKYKNSEIALYNSFKSIPKNPESKIQILKTHAHSQQEQTWADLILTTKRDIRDICASRLRREGAKPTIHLISKIVQNNISYYNSWKPHSKYEFVYEEYKKNPIKTIFEISKVLNTRISFWQVKEIIASMEAMPKRKDLPKKDDMKNSVYKQTFLTSTHNTNNGEVGGYKKYFDSKLLNLVNNLTKNWLLENGYNL